MKQTYALLLLVMLVISASTGYGQARDARLRMRGYVNPQEIVSLDSTMRMDQALLVINELSKQFAGKIILDLEKRRTPIGVTIVNQHWRDALDMILNRAGLSYVEEPDYIRITTYGATPFGDGGPTPSEPPPTLNSRDVKISAVFFSTDASKLQQYGISWRFFRSKSKEPLMDAYLATGIGRGDTASSVPPSAGGGGGGGSNGSSGGAASLDKAIGLIQSPPEFRFANIDALVKFFGSNNLGEVITSPEVIVRNGKKGKIQIGSDIFVTTRDIAGNTVNQQISTGTIIDVMPTIYTQSDTDFIYLDLSIEQSDVSPGPTINRTAVKTHALLFNGEETVIGGLFSTLDQQVREGIPVLKDLPWWFFGLRYVFGSDNTIKRKTELVILLKAELIDPIRARMTESEQSTLERIRAQRRDYDRQFKKE
jgi:hypothetical protein